MKHIRAVTNDILCALRGSTNVAPDQISASGEYNVLRGCMVEDGEGGRRAGGVLNLFIASDIYLSIHHEPQKRQSTVPSPSRDTSISWELMTVDIL